MRRLSYRRLWSLPGFQHEAVELAEDFPDDSKREDNLRYLMNAVEGLRQVSQEARIDEEVVDVRVKIALYQSLIQQVQNLRDQLDELSNQESIPERVKALIEAINKEIKAEVHSSVDFQGSNVDADGVRHPYLEPSPEKHPDLDELAISTFQMLAGPKNDVVQDEGFITAFIRAGYAIYPSSFPSGNYGNLREAALRRLQSMNRSGKIYEVRPGYYKWLV